MKDVFEKEKREINLYKLQSFAIRFYIVVAIIFTILFFLFFDKYEIRTLFHKAIHSNVFITFLKFIVGMALGIALHEIVHGIFFAIFAKKSFYSVKFGILYKPVFAFYCHCKEPLKRKQYMIAAIMPLILIGILPSIYGFYNKNLLLIVIGFILTLGALGDVFMFKLLMKENKDIFILDHPSEIGYYILKNKNF